MARVVRGSGRKIPARKSSVKRPSAMRPVKSDPVAASATVAVGFTKKSIRQLQTIFKEYPGRLREGRRLFLLAAAEVLREAVSDQAPTVGGLPYADDLRVGLVDGTGEDDMVAVWFDGRLSVLTPSDASTSLVYVQADRSKLSQVLARWSPWPADMVPVRPEGVVMVTRRVRIDEVQYYQARMIRERSRIEIELRQAGATDVRLEPPGTAVGALRHEDIGWSILRQEFGYDGERVHPVWRTALDEMFRTLPKLKKKFEIYVSTGKKGVFQLPEDEGLSKNEFDAGSYFQEALAPFVPRRVPGQR
jgi:hypothetical protein